MKIKNINFRKGDVSMSTLVMAIIAITVLLVVIIIFVSNMKKPTSEVKGVSDQISLTACKTNDGKDIKDTLIGKIYHCFTGNECPLGEDHSPLRDASCDENQICCAKIIK